MKRKGIGERIDRDDQTREDAERWPAVKKAYDFVLPSYQMLTSRFEAADSRLATVTNLATTLTLGAPILAKSIRPTIPFDSAWFIAAMTLFVCAIAIGVTGRFGGKLRLPDPAVLYRNSLHKSEWQFMNDAIYFAGDHFDLNAKAIRRKSDTSLLVACLLGCEILLLVVWIAS